MASGVLRRLPAWQRAHLRDDLQAAALLGLVRAAEAYRPERGIPFLAFAYQRIVGAALDHLRELDHRGRKDRRERRESGAPADRFVTEDALQAIEDTRARERMEARMLSLDVRRALARMPLRTQDMALSAWVVEEQLPEVGGRYGITPSAVCHVLRAATSRIRASLE